MSDNSNFFDHQTLSSKVKASIVSEYFPSYARIISTKHKPERIGFYDLFAGPGKYNDGNPSTPILLARNCVKDSFLREHVWMVFNDKKYKDVLEKILFLNFQKVHFLKRCILEEEKLDHVRESMNSL